MHTLTLTTIGNSTGVILPKDVLARLNVAKGDKLCLTETKDGYAVTVHSASFEQQMKAFEQVMNQYRNTLRELAK